MRDKLNCVMDIGERMLVCGAEVHRVEDSVGRMCTALGAARVDCFIITSSMVVTIHGDDGSVYTETRRVGGSKFDFHRLDRLNALSRRVCAEGLTLEEIRAQVQAIERARVYSLPVECFAYAIVAAAFCVFFGGGVVDALLAALIGVAVRFSILFSIKVVGNVIFSKFLSSFTITSLAYLFVALGAAPTPHKIIIGNIMLIISGLGFTNALRDLFTGDSIAGILRLLEATLCAVAIAAGYFAFIFMTGGLVL